MIAQITCSQHDGKTGSHELGSLPRTEKETVQMMRMPNKFAQPRLVDAAAHEQGIPGEAPTTVILSNNNHRISAATVVVTR
jgi:hypothetical protein